MMNYQEAWDWAIEELSLAIQLDLENGVAWLNDEASKKFQKDYPKLSKALSEIFDKDIDIRG